MDSLSLSHPAFARLPQQLSTLLEVPEEELTLTAIRAGLFSLQLFDQGFLVAGALQGSAGPVGLAADQLRGAAEVQSGRRLPLIVTPFMGPSGRALCLRAGLSWVDLCGNARIVGTKLRVFIEGRPNRFRARGRPSNLFAPKSARVTRWLLTQREGPLTQRALAQQLDLSEGLISRVLSRLQAEGYLQRGVEGQLQLKAPQRLFEAWRAAYQFEKHTLVRGHLTARSGEARTRRVAEVLQAAAIEHAATGLSAAWQLRRFATFQSASFYVEAGGIEALEAVGFREGARGANLWLVLPNDRGVYLGAEVHDGIRCVHPLQVILDLDAHPERAAEAAEALSAEGFGW